MQGAQSAAAAAPASLRGLSARLAQRPGLCDAAAVLRSGGGVILDGAAGSACALAAATLAAYQPPCLLIITASASRIPVFADDLAVFRPDPADLFAPLDRVQSPPDWRDPLMGARLRTAKSLLGPRTPPILLTCIEALMQPLPDAEELRASVFTIRTGERLDVVALMARLAALGYSSASAAALPGEFSLRGGILDLFLPEWEAPVRVELFDDAVESLREYDPATQRSTRRLSEVELTLLGPNAACRTSLFRFLPPQSWVVLVDPEDIRQQAVTYLERVGRVHRAELFPVETVLADCQNFPTAACWDMAPGGFERVFSLGAQSVERFSGRVDQVREELDAAGLDAEVFLAVPSDAERMRLSELLRDSRTFREGRLHVVSGRLSSGFRLPDERCVVLSSGEMFHRAAPPRPIRTYTGRPIDSFLELREGQLVVHVSHGIARYRGLTRLEKDGRVEEHLALEFAEGTMLYVPASKVGLVQKYVGGVRGRPKLSKLGGRLWAKQKQAAARAVFDLAGELLEVQAQRATRPGIAFPPDTLWQQEFDAAFPFEETPDQIEAAAAIKEDMLRPRPMDRLLCGDVGFGKTELAMRAAFKAVDAGYQVAVLVPTTVLAEQHLRTFRERMAEYPLRIAALSRFASPKEQKAILRGLAEGEIDIVIGTHRLAQPDVQFRNLGLVVIDEEQRFGVEIKERLKALRQMVDVLTMTATPIPRTLHMALVGIRDISNLATPPRERLAVETRVCRFDSQLIREAVLRELSREGQVYFVHNMVQDIEAVGAVLRSIVPEARIRIAHAQMPDHDLEEVMSAFVRREFDVLLTTTIIESGLDIPNANTIFIDRADRFGLADLHQLRGRVGRYKHRAYCYLLIDSARRLHPNARKRLRAIEEYSELGAGFALAMRDLEIRGAGNILGPQQSGHIAAVGYELYCELLEFAVRRLQNLPPKSFVDVDIDLPVPAYLPDDYVSDIRLKIDLYRRLSRISAGEQLAAFAEELADRFGPPPEPVRQMLALQELRISAHRLRIRAIRREQGFVVFHYVSREKIRRVAERSGNRLRIVDAETAYLPVERPEKDATALILSLRDLLTSVPYDPAD